MRSVLLGVLFLSSLCQAGGGPGTHVRYFFTGFFAAALAGVAAALRLAVAAAVAACTVFFAVAAFRLARVSLLFAVVLWLLVLPLRRDALLVVMCSGDIGTK